jgi:hypothetical protein
MEAATREQAAQLDDMRQTINFAHAALDQLRSPLVAANVR